MPAAAETLASPTGDVFESIRPVPAVAPRLRGVLANGAPPAGPHAAAVIDAAAVTSGPAVPALHVQTRDLPPPDLGTGFPTAPDDPEPLSERLHDALASKVPHLFGLAAGATLHTVSDLTRQRLGLDVQNLLDVEHTMYRVMVPSRDGYVGGGPPIFQALANGQAAYVYLSGRPLDSDLLTREYTGLPKDTLQQLGAGTDELAPVRQALLNSMTQGEFPAFVSVDGQIGQRTGTDAVATQSIASIARKQNTLSCDFPDPSSYYHWLVTRVSSTYLHVDPWLYATSPVVHATIDATKDALSPPWVDPNNPDPMGFVPSRKAVQTAYHGVMGTLGTPPTIDTLCDFADTAISLDRDLLFAVETYWVKLLREAAPAQRESLFLPLARSWVSLNLVPPDDADFNKISPATAPYIEIMDKQSGQSVLERYDRAAALSEVVEHTGDGLGIDERKAMVDTTMREILARRDSLKAREQRLRGELGKIYRGLDIDALLDGRIDGSDPNVRGALQELEDALGGITGQARPMTVQHAEILRHVTMMEWVAMHPLRYADNCKKLAGKLPLKPGEMVLTGDFTKVDNTPSSPPGSGPSQTLILGTPRPGVPPLRASVVLEGGGGLGFAYPECLAQTQSALSKSNGQVEIDEFVGTSAGSLTAGLLAAGYRMDEIGAVVSQLDFSRFYADYLWLAGATDPELRGVDRSGLFSTRQMYQTMSDLIAEKIHVTGRPVLFRDLPFKLKLVSTVINTDMPESLKNQLGIGPDGQIVFSAETTPNLDVAAAICASASVPTFFDAPEMRIAVAGDDPTAPPTMYRMQLADGGTVNNFGVALASGLTDRSLLTVMPAYDQAPGAKPGDPPVSLSVLDFDQAVLAQVNAYNQQRYATFGPQLASFLQAARDGGCDRAVIGFNPSDLNEQSAPILQGRSRKLTTGWHGVARQSGFGVEDAKAGRTDVTSFYPKARSYAEQLLIDKLIDTKGWFKPSLCHGARFNMPTAAASGVTDVMVAVVAANQAGASHLDTKLFER